VDGDKCSCNIRSNVWRFNLLRIFKCSFTCLFTLLVQNVQNDKGSHHLTKGFSIVPKTKCSPMIWEGYNVVISKQILKIKHSKIFSLFFKTFLCAKDLFINWQTFLLFTLNLLPSKWKSFHFFMMGKAYSQKPLLFFKCLHPQAITFEVRTLKLKKAFEALPYT
jgi:hypothetical protein